MTNVAIVTVFVHGLIATLLVIGGVYCLFFGFKLLFRRKAIESKSTFKATIGQHEISFTAGAAGTAVVFVSTIWVAGSIVALPSFSQTENGITVAAAIPFKGSITELALAQQDLIDTIGPTLTANKVPLVIEGYADTGNKIMNKTLAQKRAEEVKNYLIQTYNLPENRISVMSYGESSLQNGRVSNSVIIRSVGRDGG